MELGGSGCHLCSVSLQLGSPRRSSVKWENKRDNSRAVFLIAANS